MSLSILSSRSTGSCRRRLGRTCTFASSSPQHYFRSKSHHARHTCTNTCTGIRTFSNGSTSATEENNNPPPITTPSLMGSTLRGAGQVIFLNSETSGTVILGGLALGDPYLATMALAGVTTSTAAAKLGGLDQAALGDGLWGYNGALVGCAAAVFLHPLPPVSTLDLQSISSSPAVIDAAGWGLASTVMGASVAPFVGVALREAMGGVPQWTLAFNAVALGALLRTRPFAAPPAPVEEAVDATASVAGASSLDQVATMTLLEAPLRGISQIFVVDSSLTGAAIVGGTALYSPGLAGHMLLGSTVGSLTGYFLCGAPIDEITIGLWGYNSALTSMGIGTFFVHSPKTMALSIGGAAVTAGAFGAMKVVFGMWDAPCLTLPFCAVMSGCYLLGRGGVQGLQLAVSPHSPEKNE
eukprot:CAMPEP_0178610756 /NCGR_PEP_ID=MMETSP0698-20121128/259_1 /TAXON_ID=265572 /ORGANISM="Extubocellulus spinifer, Strain CCMP396" /LENGTH=410 /DNA_ID=CAMNT_0020249363 /DNA_START=21 /DNA_END=1253 /DNA_ORIENTATION=-